MGRHREFDPDQALDTALDLFWTNGFEGTSFSALTEATGVARPGLYAAFGNKEELFLKALDRYDVKHMGFMSQALTEPTARAVVERILMGSADAQTGAGTPQGCLGVNGATACSPAAEPIRQELIARRRKTEAALGQRLERAKADGDLAAWVDAQTLARYVMAISQGMAVQAKAGVSREQLHQTVALTLQMFPQ
jgi:AcrR family transcriptional regulator